MADDFKPPPLESEEPAFKPPPPVEDTQRRSVGQALFQAPLDVAKGALSGPSVGSFSKVTPPTGTDTVSRIRRALGGGTLPAEDNTPVLSSLGRGDVARGIGEALPLALGVAGATQLPRAIEAIPSAARAGRNFQTVMQAARNVPLDLSKASGPALEAHNLSEAGATLPKVMNKFIQRTTAPGSAPLNYEQGRRFASNAGRLSVQESLNANPQMKAQVAGLAKALGEANQDAATKAGVGDLYKDAMTEYRRAMKIQGAKEKLGELAKTTAAKVVAGALLGAGGYGVYRAFEK